MTLGAAVVLLIVGLVVAVLVSALGPRGSAVTIAPEPAPVAQGLQGIAASGAGATIFVHLLGAVQRPGLYQLREGDRGIDAVAAAGGFADTADQSQLNLARPLSDGEQIYVAAIGETPPPGAGTVGAGGVSGSGGAGTVAGKVNLNTADLASLDTLPGVGPATAKAIIDWRDANGRFTAVEDLLSVTGIGDKTLAELRNLVTV